jgi:hypothetical protein
MIRGSEFDVEWNSNMQSVVCSGAMALSIVIINSHGSQCYLAACYEDTKMECSVSGVIDDHWSLPARSGSCSEELTNCLLRWDVVFSVETTTKFFSVDATILQQSRPRVPLSSLSMLQSCNRAVQEYLCLLFRCATAPSKSIKRSPDPKHVGLPFPLSMLAYRFLLVIVALKDGVGAILCRLAPID